MEEAGIKGRIREIELGSDRRVEAVQRFLKVVNSASKLYATAVSVEKRDLVKRLTSNMIASSKSLVIEPRIEVLALANREKIASGSGQRDVHRTWDEILKKLFELFTRNPEQDFLLPEN